MDDYNIPAEHSTKDGITAAREDLVRERAYQLYQARNGGPGDPTQDWLQAEAEIMWKMSH